MKNINNITALTNLIFWGVGKRTDGGIGRLVRELIYYNCDMCSDREIEAVFVP